MNGKDGRRSIWETLDSATEKIENMVMSAGLLFISAIVFANVIARYFFQNSFTWSEELARYLVVWITFFGISSCARYGTHVNVDLLQTWLKGRAKIIHQAIIYIMCMAVSIYMTFISISFTWTQFLGGNRSISVAIPIWLIYLSTCIGFLFMSYVYLRKLMKLIGDYEKAKEDV